MKVRGDRQRQILQTPTEAKGLRDAGGVSEHPGPRIAFMKGFSTLITSGQSPSELELVMCLTCAH